MFVVIFEVSIYHEICVVCDQNTQQADGALAICRSACATWSPGAGRSSGAKAERQGDGSLHCPGGDRVRGLELPHSERMERRRAVDGDVNRSLDIQLDGPGYVAYESRPHLTNLYISIYSLYL